MFFMELRVAKVSMNGGGAADRGRVFGADKYKNKKQKDIILP